MEPLLNEQQAMLRDSAVKLCRDLGGPKRVRQLRAEGADLDRAAWDEITKSGWLESLGLGMGLFDLSLTMEEAGKQLLMVPLAEAAAATWALARTESRAEGLVLPALPQATWGLGESADIRFVPYAPHADSFLVAWKGTLALVAKKDVSLTTVANVDGSTSSDLVLKGAGKALASGDEAARIVAGMRELLALGASAELLGVSQAAFDATLEYIKFRQQFGKALGSFQALQHRAADCFVDIELNRSLVYRVFSAWDAGQCHPAMVSAAKARTSRSALEITRTALQLHGAIGYTDEHDIGLYYKRAIALAARYGNETNHTTQFSRLTVEG